MELKWTKLLLISLVSMTLTLLFMVISNVEDQYDPNMHVTFLQPMKGKNKDLNKKYTFDGYFSFSFD